MGQDTYHPVKDGDIDAANVTVSGTLAVTGAQTFTGQVTATAGVKDGNFAAVTADGAITIPTADKTFYITKAGVAAMTIVDPTATTHDNIKLTFISTTAQAHTLSNAAGSGFNDGGAGGDVGTFGGAKGDNITICAYQGKWYVDRKVNVTLG
jgi:hypothetical protein